jgi:hypothetical protein
MKGPRTATLRRAEPQRCGAAALLPISLSHDMRNGGAPLLF